jgi:hypothetical protein
MSSAPFGRITGRDATRLHFRLAHDGDAALGEIVAAEDTERATTFLLRVINIEYGYEGEYGKWEERTAGRMLHADRQGEPFELAEKERRLYKVAVCAPLGCVRDGVFRRAKRVPTHFSGVRKATAHDLVFLGPHLGDLEIGFLRSGEDIIPLPAGISGKAFAHHIGVFATTGMGKSNLMKCLAASTMRSGRYGLLLLDPHGEYYHGGGDRERKGLRDLPLAAERLAVYTMRDVPTPHSKIRVSAYEVQLEDIKELMEFSDAQRETLDLAWSTYGEDWLVSLYRKDARTLIEEVRAATRREFRESTVGIVKARISKLFGTPRKGARKGGATREGLLSEDRGLSITGAILSRLRSGGVVLVDTSSLYEFEELLVSVVLARATLDAYKDAYGDTEEFEKLPEVMIAFEEAQRVLRRTRPGDEKVPDTIFSRIAREGRKFKVGICAVSQQPKLIEPEVISQFNTLFVLGLADRLDRAILEEGAKQDLSTMENEIQSLMPGEAIVSSPYTPFALPVMVHRYEDYLERLKSAATEPSLTSATGATATDEAGKPAKIHRDRGFY